MPGGSKRPGGRKAGARARARPRRPVLGNDPFERGAAVREPALPSAVAPPRPAAATPPAPADAGASARTVSARLGAVERRVDAAFDHVEARLQELATRAGLPSAPGEVREAVARLFPAVKERLAAALDLVRLLEPPERLDRHGMDERFARRLEPLVELAFGTWWRVEVRDIERVPASGPAVVVANHAGAAPWEAFVVRHALRRVHPAARNLRPLLDDAACELPLIGAAAIRYGAVRASPEAALQLLREGDLIAVFPEGSVVARKPWRDRYRILRFGRGGFAKVALRAGAPIVPCAIVGCEEAVPAVSRTGWLAERLGVPLLAASPTLRLAPAGLIPLPSRWSLRFGEPIDVRPYGPGAASEPSVVAAISEDVRRRVQAMLDEGVAARTSVYL